MNKFYSVLDEGRCELEQDELENIWSEFGKEGMTFSPAHVKKMFGYGTEKSEDMLVSASSDISIHKGANFPHGQTTLIAKSA